LVDASGAPEEPDEDPLLEEASLPDEDPLPDAAPLPDEDPLPEEAPLPDEGPPSDGSPELLSDEGPSSVRSPLPDSAPLPEPLPLPKGSVPRGLPDDPVLAAPSTRPASPEEDGGPPPPVVITVTSLIAASGDGVSVDAVGAGPAGAALELPHPETSGGARGIDAHKTVTKARKPFDVRADMTQVFLPDDWVPYQEHVYRKRWIESVRASLFFLFLLIRPNRGECLDGALCVR
jgi:hypothetical protein